LSCAIVALRQERGHRAARRWTDIAFAPGRSGRGARHQPTPAVRPRQSE
jgi:hypothetical protein